jgi:hypothetical protein
MNDKRIDFMMKSDEFTSKIWKGFLAPDIFLSGKPLSPFPHLYIVNNAPTYTGGEHWCVLFVFEKWCEFFDPFGRSPIQNGVMKSFLGHCEKVKFNNIQYQSITAKTCGHHCIFFSILRARGLSCKEIKEMYYPLDLNKNDDLVFNFVVKYFGRFMAEIQEM